MNEEKKKTYTIAAKRALWWLVPSAIAAALALWVVSLPQKADADILSHTGMHSHAKLVLSVKGEPIPVPAGVGLGPVQHFYMHTHDEDNIIHLEKDGIVREGDLAIKNFFKVWKKDFSQESFMGHEAGAFGTVRMFVNGTQNIEFEEYRMKDGDVIEIRYE